ncbi:Oidioi.mRNA.OKI2018_I69.XSR.g13868.t1.cds [Oikopleura dioica]|uniref:Oidioi.mRNA.OKI2018_I69.XSR.g13868.t1.cds n=1 Tax=Oikopleura dioica TaxID=34765 RepID=A0ABN7S854_OIKDI|nr:Oidioi.mRNA.OKI2018_I69.XSR.g13868.t1.cds [Oikopleura dioica]
MHVIEAFSCASLDFDLFWTNSCCEDAVKKPALDEFAKLKTGAKREYEEAIAVARKKKVKYEGVIKAEKKLLGIGHQELDDETIDARMKCKICLERFNDGDRAMSVLRCRHVFCASCLEQVDPKHCPVCREVFTNDQIQKIIWS